MTKAYTYEQCVDYLNGHDNILILGKIPEILNISETFPGQNFTFFGFKKMFKTIQYRNGGRGTSLFHKVFIAHHIIPPINEDLKSKGVEHEAEHYYRWERTILSDPIYQKYDDLCKDMGFMHLSDMHMDRLVNKLLSKE